MYDEEPVRRRDALAGWLEMLRLPNLFTLPGDVLAGAFLAHTGTGEWGPLARAVAISFFLYISGLIFNDYFDRHEDARERPRRPIPSGRVSARSALAVAAGLTGLSLFLSLSEGVAPLFWVTSGLALLILFYNGLARKIPLVGFVVMGMCRGGNMLLGASLFPGHISGLVLTGAGAEALYIAAVSALAYGETRGMPKRFLLWLPLASIVCIALPVVIAGIRPAGILMALLASGWTFWTLRQGNRKGATMDLPSTIGGLIRGLILLQCTFIAISMGRGAMPRSCHLAALYFLLALFCISGWTGRKFKGS